MTELLTRITYGIELPYPALDLGKRVLEPGEVWIPIEILEELSETEYAGDYYKWLDDLQITALETAGYIVHHKHFGSRATPFYKEIVWPEIKSEFYQKQKNRETV